MAWSDCLGAWRLENQPHQTSPVCTQVTPAPEAPPTSSQLCTLQARCVALGARGLPARKCCPPREGRAMALDSATRSRGLPEGLHVEHGTWHNPFWGRVGCKQTLKREEFANILVPWQDGTQRFRGKEIEAQLSIGDASGLICPSVPRTTGFAGHVHI